MLTEIYKTFILVAIPAFILSLLLNLAEYFKISNRIVSFCHPVAHLIGPYEYLNSVP